MHWLAALVVACSTDIRPPSLESSPECGRYSGEGSRGAQRYRRWRTAPDTHSTRDFPSRPAGRVLKDETRVRPGIARSASYDSQGAGRIRGVPYPWVLWDGVQRFAATPEGDFWALPIRFHRPFVSCLEGPTTKRTNGSVMAIPGSGRYWARTSDLLLVRRGSRGRQWAEFLAFRCGIRRFLDVRPERAYPAVYRRLRPFRAQNPALRPMLSTHGRVSRKQEAALI